MICWYSVKTSFLSFGILSIGIFTNRIFTNKLLKVKDTGGGDVNSSLGNAQKDGAFFKKALP